MKQEKEKEKKRKAEKLIKEELAVEITEIEKEYKVTTL